MEPRAEARRGIRDGCRDARDGDVAPPMSPAAGAHGSRLTSRRSTPTRTETTHHPNRTRPGATRREPRRALTGPAHTKEKNVSDNSNSPSSTATIPPGGGASLTDLEPEGRKGRGKVVIAAVVALALVLGGLLIWRPWASGDNGKYSAADAPLRVFASVTPHADILKYVQDNLAKGDFDLQVIEETDGVNGNDVVEHGDADVSYFQHVPYLNSDSKDKGYTDLKAAATVHVEPYGIYSDKLTSLDQVPDGGLVLLSNNVSNVARGLYLLQEAGPDHPAVQVRRHLLAGADHHREGHRRQPEEPHLPPGRAGPDPAIAARMPPSG